MKKHRHLTLLALAVCCIGLGVGISAIASAGASTTAAPKAKSARVGTHGKRAMRLERRLVQGQLVVKTKTGFATVTIQRGFVESVNGSQITLREGTKQSTYKTVTLTIPAGSKVRVNHQLGSLSQITPGMRAAVVTLPKRTVVVAHTPKSQTP